MILDAAAGNRTMWRTKSAENIIYIDIERRLERKPTVFADNTKTPFLSDTFDTIFYDPPHTAGMPGGIPAYPNRNMQPAELKGKARPFTYYGGDKYKTRAALIKHLYRAEKELRRILKEDGLLRVKWNEARFRIDRVLTLFSNWRELLRLYIKSPTQTAGSAQTYWVCLTKKHEKAVQAGLA